MVNFLGPSRGPDHEATEGDWIAPTHFASPAACPPGFFFLFFPSHVHLPVTLPIDAVTVLNVFFLFSFSFFLSLGAPAGHAAHGCRDCSY